MEGRVLVIGHGYLGAPLARALQEDGYRVAAVQRGCAEGMAEPSLGYPVLSGDVSDPASLRAISENIGFSPDHIVLCASSSRGGVDAYRSVFVEGAQNLQSIFPAVPIFFTSSSSVYGQKDGSRVDENSETLPDRETGRLLLEAEKIVRDGGGTALRLAGIYGPGRSIYLERLFRGTATIEDVSPSRFLNQIHRDDAIGALLHLLVCPDLERAGKVFNVVDDTPLTQRQCYESLAALFSLPVPPYAPPDPARKRGWTHKIVSNAALRALGWEPRFSSYLDALERDPEIVSSIRDRIQS